MTSNKNFDTFTAIDPGKSKIGKADFADGVLQSAELVKIEDPPDDPGARWGYTAREIGGQISLVYEMMQVDRRTQGAKIGSIMDLCGVIGAICGYMEGRNGRNGIRGYTPSEWNKNRPKGPNQSKILRALDDVERDRLLGAEIISDVDRDRALLFLRSRPQIRTFGELYDRAVDERVGQAEHVLDAVGIGLYHLGRLR